MRYGSRWRKSASARALRFSRMRCWATGTSRMKTSCLNSVDTNFYFAAAGFHVPPNQLLFGPYYFLAVLALFTHLDAPPNQEQFTWDF